MGWQVICINLRFYLLTDIAGQLIQLTWREKVVLFWDLESLKLTKTMPLPPTVTNEGWGLTSNGTHLIMSDGSSWLFFWDPVTLKEVERCVRGAI